MPHISRRGFLAAAAGAAVTSTLGPVACASAAPASAASAQPSPPATSGKQGTATASVTLTQAQDVTAINYTITNVSAHPDTYKVSYVDEVNGRSSRETVIHVPAGGTQTGVLYGSLNHNFTVIVGLSDGTSLRLGPLGKAVVPTRISASPPPSPLPQPSPS